MPVHLRALVVLLIFAAAVFSLAKSAATEFVMDEQDFKRRRNMWFAVTVLAFLAHNFWLFVIVCAMVLLVMRRDERNPMALYFFLLFAVPLVSAKVPGFGLFNQLLDFDYPRLLCLVLLLPMVGRIRAQVKADGDGWNFADVLLIGYVLVQLGLRLQVDTLTNTIRYGLYSVLDVLLPYYVASRSLRDAQMFRDAAMAFVVVSLFLAVVGLFESVKYWLLYSDLPNALGLRWGYGNYLGRSALLRAQATTGQPIALGYIFVVAIGLHACIYRYITSHKRLWWLGFVLLIGGLIATVSRGPWVAAAIALVVFRVAGPRAVGGLMKSGIVVAVLVGAVMLSPLRDTVVDHLPFIGTVESENVVYRQRMLESSIQIILQNPWFGSSDYVYQLIDLDLVIGGMVDIVNTYIGIGLANGLVGLSCFMGLFVVAGWGILASIRKLPDPDCEERTIGQGLLACLVGTAVTIATVSSISIIPLLYYLTLGMCVGYTGIVRRKLREQPAPSHQPPVYMPRGMAGVRSRAT